MVKTMRRSLMCFAFVLTLALTGGISLAHADTSLVGAQINQGIAVADIAVEYEDGTPVEDGVVFDMFDLSMLYINPAPAQYVVKSGKLSGIFMQENTEYMLGFNGPTVADSSSRADGANPYWHTLDMLDNGQRKKFVCLYARYAGQAPLEYDFDEGINAPEKPVNKLVVHQLAEGEEPADASSTTSIMNITLSEGGYAAEAGIPISLTRRDNGKKKTVFSKQGQACLNVDIDVPYSLTIEENPTYKMYGSEIRFTVMTDSQGRYQAVIDGYNADDARGWLTDRFIELQRIDGGANPKLSFGYNDDESYEGDAPFAPGEYALVYESKKVVLCGMPVCEAVGEPAASSEVQVSTSASRITDTPIKFEFYNATLQRVEGVYESDGGVLPDIEMLRGHSFIVTALDAEYEMPNYYIKLDRTGNRPTCTKCDVMNDRIHTIYGFYLTKRTTPAQNVQDDRKVHYRLPVYYKTVDNPVAGVTVKLISPWETVETKSDAEGYIEFSLVEDWNYMVLVEDDAYSIESFPLTMKDKLEQYDDLGYHKYPFNHFSCGSISALFLVDKGTEHVHDTLMLTPSKKTTVTGLHFGSGSYFINDYLLDNSVAAGLVQGDYEVFILQAINMYRVEISKLAAGDFVITRNVADNKKVTAVYYIDGNGKLVPLAFSQEDGKVSFTMDTLSMYPNVICFEADAGKTPDDTPLTPAPSTNMADAKQDANVPQVKASSVATTASVKAKKMTVSWASVAGAKEYRLAYRSARAKAWSTLWAGGKTEASVPNLKVGGLYQLKIASYVRTGSGWLCSAYSKPSYCYYKAVKGVACKAAKSSATVTWKKDTGATGYQVVYSKNKSMKNAKTIKVTGKNKVKCTLKGLKKGAKYYVQVRPIKKYKGKTYLGIPSAKKKVKAK